MPKSIYITKASGERELFDREKLKRTCLRAGASRKLAEQIARQVEKKAYNGISSKNILKMTLVLLEKNRPHIAARYDLKGAIMRLGPAGYAFESLIAEILMEYGYRTKVHNLISGECVEHEIDVIAEKDSKRILIECKYHNASGIFTGLKEIMYTYARFLDVNNGAKIGKTKKFDEVWLCSNTKFSREAIRYASCKNMKLIGWSWPRANSLQRMIEQKKLYPITVLRRLDSDSQYRFAKAGILLCKNILKRSMEDLHDLTGISERKLKNIIQEIETIIK